MIDRSALMVDALPSMGPSQTLFDMRNWGMEQLKQVMPMRLRRKIAWKRVALRQLTARFRALPNVLIIGGQRCGTSSLYKYLGQHPEVRASIRKEIQYFTAFAERGEAWYRSHFPLAGTRSSRRTKIYFEASPDYLLDHRCAARAAGVLKDARIVAIVRNPVARALSHYEHNCQLGHEWLPFDDALDAEESRLATHRERMDREPDSPISKEYCRFSYVTRGFYAEQLATWMEHFPLERILVIESADLFRDPALTMSRLTTFLDIAPWTASEYRNYSYVGRSGETARKKEVAPSTRARLEAIYRGPNERLEQLLGRQLNW
jgi:hypothetical protein